MVIDKLGKIFEDRRKKDVKVEKDRRKTSETKKQSKKVKDS